MAASPGSVARVKMHPEGPELSAVVWGSMRSEEQFKSSSELADFLRFLLDRGITTIDTANTYGIPDPYTTEEFLGKAIAEVGREKFEIVTKCGIQRLSQHRTENHIRHFDFSEKEINRSVNRSLEKLGIEQADAILLHRPDYLMDPDETGGAIENLVATGRTRFVGVSNFSPSRYDLLASRMKLPLVTNQIEFSPLFLEPVSNGRFDHALLNRYRPMIWSPVGGGALFTGNDERTRKIRAILADIATREGLDGPAEAAYAFVVRHPAGGVPIVGSGRRERVDGAIKAANTVMDRQDWYAVVTETSPMLEL